jgi:predicted CopG family antitoxin
MATKTVSLKESAYNKLKNLKGEGESFSDLINRITSERSLTEISGIWDDEELEELVNENRERTDEEIRETAERME